jgi:excisionase family DNA binding protein
MDHTAPSRSARAATGSPSPVDITFANPGLSAPRLPTLSGPFLSTQQLADYLGVPISTVYAWREAGTAPPAHRIGKRLRFPVAGVERWLAERIV